MNKVLSFILMAALVGCASPNMKKYVWEKENVSPKVKKRDEDYCGDIARRLATEARSDRHGTAIPDSRSSINQRSMFEDRTEYSPLNRKLEWENCMKQKGYVKVEQTIDR